MICGFAITDRGAEKALNDDKVLLGGSVLSAGQVEYAGEGPVFAAVFDGVSFGGHGAEASGIATASFVDYCARIKRRADRGVENDETLEEVFAGIQAEMVDYRRDIQSKSAVATTVSGVHVRADGKITGFNSGDSRVYRFRDGMLVQMTTDHTVMQTLSDAGADDVLIDQAEETEAHVITKALGIPDGIDNVDIEDFGTFEPGDIYMGCTDGLAGFTDRQTIKRVLSQDVPLSTSGKTLVDIALKNGSYDNISVFLLSRMDAEEEPVSDDGAAVSADAPAMVPVEGDNDRLEFATTGRL